MARSIDKNLNAIWRLFALFVLVSWCITYASSRVVPTCCLVLVGRVLQSCNECTDVASLDIDAADIKRITPGAFSKLSGLKLLKLDGMTSLNGSLERGTFQGLSGLNTLSLLGIPTTAFSPGTFEGLDNLQQLFLCAYGQIRGLSGNSRSILPSGTFQGLKTLPNLELRGCLLQGFAPGAFNGLDKLNMLKISSPASTFAPDATPLQVFNGSFDGMPQLQKLEFQDAGPEPAVDETRAYASLTHLKELTFYRCVFGPVFLDHPGALYGLEALEQLSITGSTIILDPGAFRPLENLQNLSFEASHFNFLHFSQVPGSLCLDSLRSLIFSNAGSEASLQMLNCSGLRETALGNLRELRLSDFLLPTFSLDLLSGMKSLELLEISDTALTNLNGGTMQISEMPSLLQTLILKGNFIAEIRPGIFRGLPSLRELDISQSCVPSFSNSVPDGYSGTSLLAGAFMDVPLLQTLNTDCRKLRGVEPGAFEGLALVKSLSFSCSVLRSNIGREFAAFPSNLQVGVFKGLSGLESLEIQYGLTDIQPEALADLKSLRQFVVGCGFLSAMQSDTFRNVSALEVLQLNLPNFMVSSLRHDTFKHLSNLRTLRLSGLSGQLPSTGVECPVSFDELAETCIDRSWISDGASHDHSSLASSAPLHAFRGEGFFVLPDFSMQPLKELQTLELTSLSLKGLSNSSLAGLAALKTLVLSGNSIQSLPVSVFQQPNISLQKLEILFNGAPLRVPPGVFEGMSSLVDLQLCVDTSQGAPPSSIQLQPGSFWGLSGIQKLNLRNCGLSNLTNGIFGGLTALKALDLSANSVRRIEPGAFIDTSSIIDLQTSDWGGSLHYLAPKSFAGLQSLRRLDLSGSGLRSVAPAAFAGLPKLQDLILESNSISALAPDTFTGLPNLLSLYLANNHIRNISSHAFSGLSKLKQLVLRSSASATDELQLHSLSKNQFWGLSALESLDLSNAGIDDLDADALNGLETLSSLDLSNNNISVLPTGLFASAMNNTISKQTVLLSNNSFQRDGLLPACFGGLTARATIDIQGNSKLIACPTPSIFGLSNNVTADDVALGILSTKPALLTGACSCLARGIQKVDGQQRMCVVSGRGIVAAGNELIPCPQGRYSDQTGAFGPVAEVCVACGAGRFNPFVGRGSESCLTCPRGRFQPESVATSASSCVNCRAGRFAAATGSEECTPCSRGFFSESIGGTECLGCPVGKYGQKNTTGASSEQQGCDSCPAGRTTVSTGTPNIKGCSVEKEIPCPSKNQYRRLNDSRCADIVCGEALIEFDSLCFGCPPGYYGSPRSISTGNGCRQCSDEDICPGNMMLPANWLTEYASKSTAIDQFRQKASATGTVRPFIVSQVYAAIFIGLAALIIPSAALLASNISTRVRKLITTGDLFALSHFLSAGSPVVFVPTGLGGSVTLSFLAVGAGLAICLLIEFLNDNHALLVEFVPVANHMPGFTDITSDLSFLLVTVIAGQLSAGTGICVSVLDTVSIPNIDTETQPWRLSNGKSQYQPENNTTICSYIAECRGCQLDTTTPLMLRAVLPFQAQTVHWLLSTSRVYDEALSVGSKMSFAEGSASANSQHTLKSVISSFTATREILTHGTGETAPRSTGYAVAPGHSAVAFNSANFTDGFIPGLFPVTVDVSVDVAISGIKSNVQAKTTLLGLLGSLGGILGGLLAAYQAAFPYFELCAQRMVRSVRSRRSAKQKSLELRRRLPSKRPRNSSSHSQTAQSPMESSSPAANPLSTLSQFIT